jgi:AraC-like DNA-binding protein
VRNASYQEYAASPRLAQRVECFWTLRATADLPAYPVLPDGCIDILFGRRGNSLTGLQVVGAMTRRCNFAIPAGQYQFGVRFRPAMGRAFLRLALAELTDQILPLEDLWGSAARRLGQQIAEARSVGQAMARVENLLGDPPAPGPVERAVAWLVDQNGQVSVDDLARAAGLSARQFRRVCLEASGLTPKYLARVVRFRRALARVEPGRSVDWAQIALECGYFDQAHFINDFRRFSGETPAEYAARRAAPPVLIVQAAD